MSEAEVQPDPLGPATFDTSQFYLNRDAQTLRELVARVPADTPEGIAMHHLAEFFIAATFHHERVDQILAERTAPKPRAPRRPRAAKAQVIKPRDGQREA